MTQVKFFKFHDWALPPVKEIINLPATDASSIRWFSKERVKGACYPYKLGKQIGWTILSPIDIEIHPVDEVQIRGTQDDVLEVGNITGIDFWVQRDGTFIGIKPAGWFQIMQAKVNGIWQGLFIPNGEKTFEWRLGWGVVIPEDYMMLIQPIEGQENFIIHPGLLFSKSLDKFNYGLGQGIAFEPKNRHKISRGDPLAKILIIHKSSLDIEAEVEERIEN